MRLRGADGKAMAVYCGPGKSRTEKTIVRVYHTQEHGQRSLPSITLSAWTVWHGQGPQIYKGTLILSGMMFQGLSDYLQESVKGQALLWNRQGLNTSRPAESTGY